MDIDALLQTFGEDAPSGEDLEYDQSFTELEIAAQPGEERQAGDEILAASEPDYNEVSKLALAVLQRSHDLRAAIYFAEAQLRLKGLPGFAQATSYLSRCLDEHWDNCHPQLDEEDDNDPTMRVNAVLSLTDSTRILRGVRRAPLTSSRTFGKISLRDIAVAEGDITAPVDMSSVPDVAGVAAAFQDTAEDTLREIAEAAATALSDVQSISAKFDSETPGQGPDLDPLIKMLKLASTRLSGALGDPDVAEAGGTELKKGQSAPDQKISAHGAAVNSPNDVQNALDRIIAYYQRYEPSSPLPLLLLRAKTLVSADFVTIVKNMAPGGLDNVNLIGGIEDDYD